MAMSRHLFCEHVCRICLPIFFQALRYVCSIEKCVRGLVFNVFATQGKQKKAMEQDGIPWWVWSKILDNPDHVPRYYPYHPYRKTTTTTTTEAPPPAQMFPCVDAEPQSPRNLTASFVGLEPPRVKPVGSLMNQERLPLCTVAFMYWWEGVEVLLG